MIDYVNPAGLAGKTDSLSALSRQLILLSAPVMAEHVLHMMVGLTDTWMATHLDRVDTHAATAAVASISYILWFIGMIVGTIGSGSTAIIARAKGARHRSLANKVCGQSVISAALVGIALALVMRLFGPAIVDLSQLHGEARADALSYLNLLAWALPFSTVMFVAGSCLRGAGDTLSPALAMIAVDLINMVLTLGLSRGQWGMPRMGFDGIAMGTVIAYIAGGVILTGVLLRGRGGLRLHLHRLRPHWHTLRRVLRIGIPSGFEGVLSWIAQYGVLVMINNLDQTNISSSAHILAIRIEGISFMAGFAVATAAAAMVGQSLGMNDPRRARRSAYLAYALGGGIMVLCGMLFITMGQIPAGWLAAHDPPLTSLTARCLHIAGFIQFGFAASAIFGGALRGAGDTFSVMVLNLVSIIFVRFCGVWIAIHLMGGNLVTVWYVLCGELIVRGALVYARFAQGGWARIRV